MAPLEIRKAGDPVLKQHCEPVEKIDKNLKLTLDAMAETMYQNDGVGLAAPQVGLPLRMVVTASLSSSILSSPTRKAP